MNILHKPGISRVSRRGAIAPLSLFMLVPMIACMAFSVELARISAVKAELQRTADAAAMAAAWDLLQTTIEQTEIIPGIAKARFSAQQSVMQNPAGNVILSIDSNSNNSEDGEIAIGTYLPTGVFEIWHDDESPQPNAVRVTVQRSKDRNGSMQMLFGKFLGVNEAQFSTTTIAGFLTNFRGFKAPPAGETIGVLPFTVRDTTWAAFTEGAGSDDWTFDKDSGAIFAGGDGVLELNIFPHTTGSSGNSGTINFGASSNSTNTLRRHIREGLNADDLAHLPNGRLELDADGMLLLNGDTGISAGMKDAISEILGQPRILPLYSSVSGNGNNAYFQIVAFVGVRIVEVDLTGSKNKNKKILIQPAPTAIKFGIPSTEAITSEFLFTPVNIVK